MGGGGGDQRLARGALVVTAGDGGHHVGAVGGAGRNDVGTCHVAGHSGQQDVILVIAHIQSHQGDVGAGRVESAGGEPGGRSGRTVVDCDGGPAQEAMGAVRIAGIGEDDAAAGGDRLGCGSGDALGHGEGDVVGSDGRGVGDVVGSLTGSRGFLPEVDILRVGFSTGVDPEVILGGLESQHGVAGV